jgi:hypothetical protein
VLPVAEWEMEILPQAIRQPPNPQPPTQSSTDAATFEIVKGLHPPPITSEPPAHAAGVFQFDKLPANNAVPKRFLADHPDFILDVTSRRVLTDPAETRSSPLADPYFFMQRKIALSMLARQVPQCHDGSS